MSKPTIRFLFDVLSPYAYLAWCRLPSLATARGVEVEPVPVLLAALLAAGGQKGPAEIPAKRDYVILDIARSARKHSIPLGVPPSHPFNPLLALRAISIAEPSDRARLTTALFEAVWAGGPGVTDPAVVSALVDRCGLDGAALVTAASTEEAKSRVRAQTDAALAAGIFGVPSMLLGDELFWGFDAMDALDRRLGGEPPPDAALVARWKTLQASAVRRTS